MIDFFNQQMHLSGLAQVFELSFDRLLMVVGDFS